MPEPAQEWGAPNARVVEEFRANGGTVGGRFAGLPLLLLTVVGARSGRRRTVPLTYIADGERYVVGAGAAGANPAWYHNVLAHPGVTVEVGTDVFDATAVVTTGSERAALFDRYAAEQPQLLSFQEWADRDVPMIALTPVHPEQTPTNSGRSLPAVGR